MEIVRNDESATRIELRSSGRRPALIPYAVKDPADAQERAMWTRIGAAWPHQQGRGYWLLLEVLPLDGRVALIDPAEPKIIAGCGAEAA